MCDRVEVLGTGHASAVPDAVVIDVRIHCEAESVAEALDDAATRTDAALRAAADHGILDSDRRTTGLGVGTRWDHQGAGAIVGHTAHQTLRLTVRDRRRTGAVLQALAGSAGDALAVDAVSLEVTDSAPLLQRARAAAFEDARARATQYARLAERELGGVLRITEGSTEHGPAPRMLAAAQAEAAQGMPVEPGESSVTATVVVRFARG